MHSFVLRFPPLHSRLDSTMHTVQLHVLSTPLFIYFLPDWIQCISERLVLSLTDCLFVGMVSRTELHINVGTVISWDLRGTHISTLPQGSVYPQTPCVCHLREATRSELQPFSTVFWLKPAGAWARPRSVFGGCGGLEIAWWKRLQYSVVSVCPEWLTGLWMKAFLGVGGLKGQSLTSLQLVHHVVSGVEAPPGYPSAEVWNKNEYQQCLIFAIINVNLIYTYLPFLGFATQSITFKHIFDGNTKKTHQFYLHYMKFMNIMLICWS